MSIWTWHLLAARFQWIAVAFIVAASAAIFFSRFDPAREVGKQWKFGRTCAPAQAPIEQEAPETFAPWDALNAFLSDPSVTRYMHFSSWDEEMRREWLASVVQRASNFHRDAYDWAITLRSNGLLIGWLIVGRSRHARDPGLRDCGCGYALHQHYWGQGYMPEALQAAFTYAFMVLLTQRIHAECERENTASARVMQKCGMQYEGTFYDDDGLGNWAHRDRYVITAES